MRHDELIGQVQSRAKLASRGEAERLTRAALETLGERIPDRLAGNLASQLPHEVGEHLRRTAGPGAERTGERLDRDEFIDRVAERSGLKPPAAAYGARVVLELVDEATTGGVVRRVGESLPDDLAVLLFAGSTGAGDRTGGGG